MNDDIFTCIKKICEVCCKIVDFFYFRVVSIIFIKPFLFILLSVKVETNTTPIELSLHPPAVIPNL